MARDRPSSKWWKSAECYKMAAGDCGMDFSDKAASETFVWESRGGPKPVNGYTYGKQQLDILLAMWREDMSLPGWPPVITKAELLDEGWPQWLLDTIIF